ncbi:MAG: S8 family serine peptidase [Gemmatimonadales bacterium]
MKPHLIVTLRPGTPAPVLPHWSDIIADKTVAGERLDPAVDAVLRRWRCPVWVAGEFRPAGEAWSPSEIAAGLNRIYRLILQRDAGIPDELIRDICLVPTVEQVRPGAVQGAPLPRPVAAQMSTLTDQASREAIYLAEAHRVSRGDPSVTVAVLDTGISRTHPELAGVVLPGFDFVDIIDGHDDFVGDFIGADADPDDEVGHGTHVAGIIAGRGAGMPAGVVPRCRILPVRVLGAMRQGPLRVGAGLVDNINNAIKWAVDHGAQVINMSLGIRRTGGGLPHAEVVEYARRKGVTVVAAAGNDGRDELYYPGALPHVVAVGAFGEDGEVAPFSTYGNQVSVIAPGENIFSSHLQNDYAFASGTSQAAPFVAGAVALLKSAARATAGAPLSDSQVKHILKHTSDKVDARFKHRKAGYGKLNLADALRLLDFRLSGRTEPWRTRRTA